MPDFHKIGHDLADYQEQLIMLEEAARGYREHLEAQGWSPTIAEHMAAGLFFGPLINPGHQSKGGDQ